MRDSADADEESHEREDGDRNETARPEGARHTQKQVLEQAIFQNGCKYLRYKTGREKTRDRAHPFPSEISYGYER